MAGVCDIPVIADVCSTVGEGTASLIAAPFDWLAATLAGAAAWIFEAVWTVFYTTTLIDVTEAQYLAVYNVLFGVAVFVMLIFFCLQLITGLIHRDPGALGRAAVGLMKSVLGSFIVVAITATLLEVTDQIAIGIVQATGNTMEGMGDRLAMMMGGLLAIGIGSPGVGAIITIFLAGVAVAGAAIVWFSLLIRKALLLVAIVFAPIALAGMTWDVARGWVGKWASFVVALVFSKLVLVVMFLVAINQTSAPIDLDLASVADPIAGVVVMLIAAFAPYMTYKFISFVGVDMYHAMSTEQEAKSAINRPIPVRTPAMPQSATSVLDASGGKGAGTPPATTPGQTVPGASAEAGAGAASQATAPTAAPAAGGSAAAGAGGSGAAAGGAGAGAAAAAGPAAAVIVAAEVAKAGATAGPKAGAAVGGAAAGHADAAAPATPDSPGAPPARAVPPSSPPPVPRTSAPVPPAPSKPSVNEPASV